MNDMLKRPLLPEWLTGIWEWMDAGPKYITVLILWSVFWLWLILWVGNIEYCPGREKSYHYCAHDWINWASFFSCILMWIGGVWATFLKWEND